MTEAQLVHLKTNDLNIADGQYFINDQGWVSKELSSKDANGDSLNFKMMDAGDGMVDF